MSDIADDLLDALYAEWLMHQPEAMICNGHRLVECMERQWGWDDFMAALPDLLVKSAKEFSPLPPRQAP